MFANFVKLYYKPSKSELELLNDPEIEQIIDTILREQKSFQDSKFTGILDHYLQDYKNTQPEIINDHLLKWNQPMAEWINKPVQLWTIPPSVLDQLNKGYFKLENIKQNHGEQQVFVLSQNKNPQDVQQNELTHMQLAKYIDYLSDQENCLKNKSQQSQNKVLTLMQLFIEDWELEALRLYEYLPTTVQKDDGLSYLRFPIKGVNQLLLNMMTEGSWVGGHQEQVNYLNLNHGPGICTWTIIDPEHSQRLFHQCPNLLQSEGNWLRNTDFFIQQKIPYRKFNQKPGDLLFLGAGTVFQVECISTTITTGWSFIAKNSETFTEMYKRTKLNSKYNIKPLLPVRNLFLDMQLHSHCDLLKSYLQEFLKEEIDRFIELKKLKKLYSCDINYHFRKYCICSECKREILLCCYKSNSKVFCIWCEKTKHIQLQCKYNPQLLQLAIDQTNELKCSLHYCSKYVTEFTDCNATFKQSKPEEKKESIVSVKESSTSNVEAAVIQKSYIKYEDEEEEKEIAPKIQKKQQKNKVSLKIEDDNFIKIKNSKANIDKIRVKGENINKKIEITSIIRIEKEQFKVLPKKEKKQNEVKQKEVYNKQTQLKPNQGQDIIVINDEAPNLLSYPIKTRKREEILVKQEQEKVMKDPKKNDCKIQIKTEKQKVKFMSAISKLTEEEINTQLGIKESKEVQKILKKGEKNLIL